MIDLYNDTTQAATSFRRHHPDVYAAASAAVHPTKGVVSLASRPSGGALEAARDWWFKFGVLLRRDLQAYARNPANAIFRFAAYVGVAVLSGTYLYKIGEGRGLLGLNIVIGAYASSTFHPFACDPCARTHRSLRPPPTNSTCPTPSPNYNPPPTTTVRTRTADLFFSLLAQELFPYVSQSLFAHSRAFYSVENAAGLYPPSCYYCSLVLTELALNASCGFVSGAYSYYSNGFATFFNPARPWAACAGWSAFVMLLNSVTNVRACSSSIRPAVGRPPHLPLTDDAHTHTQQRATGPARLLHDAHAEPAARLHGQRGLQHPERHDVGRRRAPVRHGGAD